MSKAFTKEDDGSAAIVMPDLPQSHHPNYVTSAGLEALKERLDVRRAELAELRTNDDGLDTRQLVALADRDIRYLRSRVDGAILVRPEDQPSDVVAFGMQVEVIHEDDTNHTYRIVGEDEADPSRGLITPYSPLAVALIGAKTGDTVEWRKPSGIVELVVHSIIPE